jgi:hypothetical protein
MGKIRIYTNESVDVAIPEGLKRRGEELFDRRMRAEIESADICAHFRRHDQPHGVSVRWPEVILSLLLPHQCL